MFNYTDSIMPVEEMMNYDEFTDRVEILRELEEWVKDITIMGSGSTAIMSPRRMGKTSLLDRLVNMVFFKDYNVAPFYFKMKREEITLKKFLLEYATTFYRQYIAYCLKDAVLYRNKRVKLEDLLEIQSTHRAVILAKDFIKEFLRRYNSTTHEDARNHWDAFIIDPEDLASFSGTSVAVIIDEFQDMKFNVYDTQVILADESTRPMPIDLTVTYVRQGTPMLISSSDILTSELLQRKFKFKYLTPLSIADGATLIKNLLKPRRVSISEENAIYISSKVGGHPYYLYCCATSDLGDKGFDRKQDIDRLIEYEIQRGKIFGFWDTCFACTKQYINDDSDMQLGKKVIQYFTKSENQSVQVDEIANKLMVGRVLVEEKIEKLYMVNLVHKSNSKYYSFNDIMLMKWLEE